MDRFEHCAAIVRAADRDRYLSDLFAPAGLRPFLFALHAFDAEVGRIPGLVSEPHLGEIRLAWWRDALRDGEAGQPVVAALGEAMGRFALPVAAIERYLEARVFDLYNDPMPDLATFEGYAGDTASAVFQLGAIVLAGGGDPMTAGASGYAGVAATILRVLRNLGADAARRRCFVPRDVLARHGTGPDDLFAGRTTEALREALAEMRALARQRLGEALRLVAAADPQLRVGYLPLAVVEAELRALEAPGFDPLRGPPPALSSWRRQWLIWRAARRWAAP